VSLRRQQLFDHNWNGVAQGVGISVTFASSAAMYCPRFRTSPSFFAVALSGWIGGIIMFTTYADRQDVLKREIIVWRNLYYIHENANALQPDNAQSDRHASRSRALMQPKHCAMASTIALVASRTTNTSTCTTTASFLSAVGGIVRCANERACALVA
jgi:hypothetical protein